MSIILSCKELSKGYNHGTQETRVLKKINLEIEEHSINFIYGKSGSGKTTLLNLLAGLDVVTSGEIVFRDIPYSTLKEELLAKIRGEHYGFVFQSYHLINRISIEDNILCPGYVNHKKIDMTYYNYLMEALGIKTMISKKAYQLSGGEQQRVAIARAMILKPEIIFADEPTGNLDSVNTRIILDLFHQLNERFDTTFLIVTHEENRLRQDNRVIRIKDGAIDCEKTE